MKIHIIAIGKIKEKYLREGIAEYCKRIKPYASLEISEILEEKMPENPSPAEKVQVLNKEAEKLLARVNSRFFLVALDMKGKKMSSEALADFLNEKALTGQSQIAILIGGAYGLGEQVRKRADLLLSFSDFTFTHQLIRLLLIEQLYRAFKIIHKEKYHN